MTTIGSTPPASTAPTSGGDKKDAPKLADNKPADNKPADKPKDSPVKGFFKGVIGGAKDAATGALELGKVAVKSSTPYALVDHKGFLNQHKANFEFQKKLLTEPGKVIDTFVNSNKEAGKEGRSWWEAAGRAVVGLGGRG